jgi:MFS superfamily sulfate permease-like transporter
VGIGLVVFASIDQHGVAVIAEVPRGLLVPHLPPLHHLGDLTPYALAIALLAYLESISVARATRETTDPALDNDQELVAVGTASVAGAFFQTVPAAGGFSQTLVNADAGARTQMSELVTVALALVVALVLAPLLSDLPQATLGAIVLVAVTGLISFRDLARLARLDRVEFVVAVITGAIALLTNLLVGVAAGVVLTFYLLLRLLNIRWWSSCVARRRAATWRPRGRVTRRSPVCWSCGSRGPSTPSTSTWCSDRSWPRSRRRARRRRWCSSTSAARWRR